MYPILYNTNGIYFHNGKGKLVDCISCVVSEELNGDYSLEFTYPITGPLFNELLEGGSVSVICPHMEILTGTGFVPMRAAEWFDIYKHSIPINGVVTFYANHVSRRLARLVYAGGKIGTGTGSVDGVLNRAQPSVSNGYDGLRFYTSPHSPPAVRDIDVPVQSVLATYIGAENSFVSNFGGDFIWTSDSLVNTEHTPPLTTRGYYVSHRGEDRGAEIRYGFNMTDVENVEDSIDTYNAVVPYWEDSDGNRVFANGFLVQSDPPQTPIRAVPLNCSAWYDTQPTSEQLISTAQNHLANHTPWNVVETLTVDFINGVEIDPHGAEIALGDTVHIYWKDGKIDSTLRVVSYKYDALAERYSELKLGTQQTHFVAVTGAESYSGATGGGSSGGGLPSGGTQGQALFKNSSADGDAIWSDLPTKLTNVSTPTVAVANCTGTIRSTLQVLSNDDGSIFCLSGRLAITGYARRSGNPGVSIDFGFPIRITRNIDVGIRGENGREYVYLELVEDGTCHLRTSESYTNATGSTLTLQVPCAIIFNMAGET